MLIDWFTVGAQLVNFLILVVALKFLLYDRIMAAMEKRRQSIADQEAEADRKREEAAAVADRLEEERRELKSHRQEIIAEARRESEERLHELLEEARSEVELRQRRWSESVLSQQDKLLTEMQRTTGEQAMAISRRALRDLADSDLEREVIRAFIGWIAGDSEECDQITEALRADDTTPLLVRTAFELTEDDREEIRQGLHRLAETPEREIEWERDPDLIAGVVVQADSRSIGWAVSDYLNGLEDTLADLLREQLGAAVGAAEGTDATPEELDASTSRSS